MEWIDVEQEKPVYGKIVKVILDDGRETYGFIDDNDQRTCWLIKGTGGQYWRSMISSVTKWKELPTEDEIK